MLSGCCQEAAQSNMSIACTNIDSSSNRIWEKTAQYLHLTRFKFETSQQHLSFSRRHMCFQMFSIAEDFCAWQQHTCAWHVCQIMRSWSISLGTTWCYDMYKCLISRMWVHVCTKHGHHCADGRWEAVAPAAQCSCTTQPHDTQRQASRVLPSTAHSPSLHSEHASSIAAWADTT